MRRRLIAWGLPLLVALVLCGGGVLAVQRWMPVRVAGGSMQPTLKPGDLVVVDRAFEPQAGRIALLETPRHGRYLHRVTAVGAGGEVRTRGDANEVTDFDAVSPGAVLGSVVYVVPIGRWLGR